MLSRVSDPAGAGISGWIAEPEGNARHRHLLRRGRRRRGAGRGLPGHHPRRPGRRRARSSSPATGRRSTRIQARMAAARARDRRRSTTGPAAARTSTSSWCRRPAPDGPIDVYQISPQTAARPLSRSAAISRPRSPPTAASPPRAASPTPASTPRSPSRGRRSGRRRSPSPICSIRCRPRSTSSCRSGPAIRWSSSPAIRSACSRSRGEGIAEVRCRGAAAAANFARAIKRFVEKGLARDRARAANGVRGDMFRERRGACAAPPGRIFHETQSFRAGFGASSRRRRAGARAAGRRAGRSGRRPASRYAPWGVDLSRARPGGQAGRRFLALRQQHAGSSANPIPADRTGWGVGTVLSEDVEAQLRAIVETADRGTDPVSRQVGDYLCELDGRGRHRGARRRRRCAPISTASPRRATATICIRLFATPGYPVAGRRRHHPRSGRSDPLHRRRRPGRPRHAQPRLLSARGRAVSTATAPPIAPMWSTLQRLAGIADPEAKADAIIALERRIAEAHWTPERSRDIQPDRQSDEPRPARRAGAAVQLAAAAPAARASATCQTDHRRPDHRDPGRRPAARRACRSRPGRTG